MVLPVPQHVPGDCYMWGSSQRQRPGGGTAGHALAAPAVLDRSESDVSVAALSEWHHSAAPIMMNDTTHLDIQMVRN